MKKYLILLALVLGLSDSQAFGWATIITAVKGGDNIVFTTNLSDVNVFLDGNQVGVVKSNAFEYKIKRNGNGRTFTFKKDGYKDASVTLTTTFDNFFWLNAMPFIGGGFFGSSTDSWSTNNTREYTPNQFYIDMIKN